MTLQVSSLVEAKHSYGPCHVLQMLPHVFFGGLFQSFTGADSELHDKPNGFRFISFREMRKTLTVSFLILYKLNC